MLVRVAHKQGYPDRSHAAQGRNHGLGCSRGALRPRYDSTNVPRRSQEHRGSTGKGSSKLGETVGCPTLSAAASPPVAVQAAAVRAQAAAPAQAPAATAAAAPAASGLDPSLLRGLECPITQDIMEDPVSRGRDGGREGEERGGSL